MPPGKFLLFLLLHQLSCIQTLDSGQFVQNPVFLVVNWTMNEECAQRILVVESNKSISKTLSSLRKWLNDMDDDANIKVKRLYLRLLKLS